jgi:hypothetical protein
MRSTLQKNTIVFVKELNLTVSCSNNKDIVKILNFLSEIDLSDDINNIKEPHLFRLKTLYKSLKEKRGYVSKFMDIEVCRIMKETTTHIILQGVDVDENNTFIYNPDVNYSVSVNKILNFIFS